MVGIDARDEGLELTKKSGADVTIDARIGHDKVVQRVKKVTNGKGVPVTINVSDAAKAMATSCAITRMHGTVIQLAQVGNGLSFSTPRFLTSISPIMLSSHFRSLSSEISAFVVR